MGPYPLLGTDHFTDIWGRVVLNGASDKPLAFLLNSLRPSAQGQLFHRSIGMSRSFPRLQMFQKCMLFNSRFSGKRIAKAMTVVQFSKPPKTEL